MLVEKLYSEKTTATTNAYDSTSPSVPNGNSFEKIIEISEQDTKKSLVNDENKGCPADSIFCNSSHLSQINDNNLKIGEKNLFTA